MMQLVSAVRGPIDKIMALRRHDGRRAPSPPTHGPLGHLAPMRADRLDYVLRNREEYGDVVRMRFGHLTAHFLAHPDHVKHVLVDNARRYDKQTKGFNNLRLILGNGLLTSEGDFWRRQRRIAQPAFHRDRITSFAPCITQAAESLCEEWQRPARAGEAVDVAAEMMRLALRIAGETLLSTDVTADADVVGSSIAFLLRAANDRIMMPLELPMTVPTPGNLRIRRAIDALDVVVHRTIDERRRSSARPNDLLTMLMEARDEETGEAMSNQQLRDEVMTIFLAGHETTANAMGWTFYLLSKHPDVERLLRAELHEVLGGRSPTLADLPQLACTKRVIQESMRLYPPAWMVGRRAALPDEIGGYPIDAGSLVFVSPWLTHHHPAFWENPEGFDPDRFLPDRAAALPRFAYFPFGAGPRLCIGQGFAMMETQLLLATIAQRFRMNLVPGHPVVADPCITLRPRSGIRMTLHATQP